MPTGPPSPRLSPPGSSRAGAELIRDADLIVPVPLHWSRLFSRRYNQAALLALALGQLTGKVVMPDLLTRRRATAQQGHLGRLARQRNVAGAFALHPRRAAELSARRVLLIDDVITTGCHRHQLRQGPAPGRGAAAVDVLALARVIHSRLRPENPPSPTKKSACFREESLRGLRSPPLVNPAPKADITVAR